MVNHTEDPVDPSGHNDHEIKRPLQEPGNEADPAPGREIPGMESGEIRWMRRHTQVRERDRGARLRSGESVLT